ncbi:hypothetical protein FIC_00325 [Flavobacteriaceae bacterium 3519-10]|nr:hypothetical protein FIC_00325 [Flavobacteriaceae bacterium 3519-10]
MNKKRHFMMKTALALFMVLCSVWGWGQAALPLSRTTWTGAEPTGWTQNQTTDRTSSGACSGSNALIFGTNGAWAQVYFSSTPDKLNFSLKKQSTSGQSKVVAEQSSDGAAWTIIGEYGTATGSTAITDCGNIQVSLLSTTRYIRWTYTKATGNIDMDDVSISAGAEAVCNEGALTAGTTTATTTQVAPGGSSSLSLTGASTGTGLSYQWQSSPDGSSWSNISNAPNATYNATNITASTYYRAALTCGSTTVYSTSVYIDVSYCPAGATNTAYEKIANFSFININNPSTSTAGYENFTAINTDASVGSHPFSIAISDVDASDQILIWIDLDQNNTFDNSELVHQGSILDGSNSTVSGTITIPSSATQGSTRLRIRLHYTSSPGSNNTSCGDSSYGQVEDYTINILPSSPTIIVDGSSLAAFTYTEGNGPSGEQSFGVTGNNLTNNITATAPNNWVVSATAGSGYNTTATLPAAGGTVYIRLAAGLAVNPSYTGNIVLTSTGATSATFAVSGSVTAPITAQSNDTNFGTVTVTGNVITATPSAEYTYADPAYTILSGDAAVTQNGNEFTVTASSATTVQINFAAKPTYTLSLLNDGVVYSDATYPYVTYEGNTVVLPTLANCGTSTFAGWDTNSATSSVPTYAGGANYTTTASNVTLFAVYSETVGAPEQWTKVSALGDIVAGTYVILNGDYYLPNTNTTAAAPPAQITLGSKGVNVSGNILTGTITSDMRWIFTGTNTSMAVVSAANSADKLYNINNNNGVRVHTTDASWVFETHATTTPAYSGFAMKHNNRYCAVYSGGEDWRSYQTKNAANYGTNGGVLDIFKKSGGSTTIYTTSPNCAPAIITWNGSAWSNTTGPDASTQAVIDADYAGPEFAAQSLIVNAGATLTVSNYVTTGDVTNNGHIIVADGANFVQTGTFTPGTDSSFKVRKSTKAVKRLAYVNWSSPMNNSAQTLKQFSYGKKTDGTNQSGTGTVDNRFFTYNNNAFVSILPGSTFNPAGAGFLIRTPNDFTTTGQVFNGQFEGTTPNSGTISYDHSGIGGDYVMLGNPYPSAISLDDFLTANPGTTETVYIWNSQAEMDANNQYTGTNYNTYAPGTGSVPVGSIDGYIPVGQAFFVERATIPTTTPFVFTNALRQTTQDGVFTRGATADKFWLELTSPSGSKPQMLIGFNAAARAWFDAGFDAALIGSNADALYSTVDSRKLVIDAHSSFTADDSFALNADISAAGSYTIGVLKTEGVFANGQQIWLKDQVTGSVTLISEQPYTFTAEAGTVADRFTLQFKPGGALATDGAVKAGITIFSSGSEIHARAAEHISSVEVYEMSGKLIANSKTSQKEITMHVPYKGVVLVKVVLQNGTVQTKKLMLK